MHFLEKKTLEFFRPYVNIRTMFDAGVAQG